MSDASKVLLPQSRFNQKVERADKSWLDCQVDETFRSQSRIADILYCVAGGNHAENGFLVDIKAKDLESCMRNNYYSSAYAAKSMLDIWTEDDKKGTTPGPHPRLRQIVFINSAAAFVALPGSIAYTRKLLIMATQTTLRHDH